MFNAVKLRFKRFEHALDASFGNSISTPLARFGSTLHFHLMDHAFLRVFWTNLYEIAPGVWRSNQPSPARLKWHAEQGFKSVITLRGPRRKSYTLFEEEACEILGLTLHTSTLRSRGLVPKEEVLRVLDLFETAEKPFVMHCKSGADRAGLASVLYVLSQGGSLEEAKKQLSFKYLHLKNDRTGILDMMIQAFEDDHLETGIDIRQWIETKYDPDELGLRFNAGELRTSKNG